MKITLDEIPRANWTPVGPVLVVVPAAGGGHALVVLGHVVGEGGVAVRAAAAEAGVEVVPLGADGRVGLVTEE